MLRRLFALLLIQVSITLPVQAANILYLNSTRGQRISLGGYRNVIADTLDNYGDGTIFDVDFVQTHVAGDLAS
ncbi:MAG: hypothetical protein AAGA60_00930 [Cyanobacteria bacterium P01_E01_bin.42]